ncbi:HU family DNA-binding protein [Pseudophaeobacter sp.]|uniref:HU family DNA-binding protein n=1 Tax=Pseudophaeobacter sp. TaxID=1971739 RepID=UPI003297B4F9
MASSKTLSHKATGKKPTARKTLPSKSAIKARLQTASPPKQAPEGSPLSLSTPDQVSPPSALAAGQQPSPVVVKAAEPELKQPPMNKKELIDAAVLRSGIKKKDAKPVVEALLAVLGETVAQGRDLNLRPFGKLHLNRSETRSNGTIHICRLRQPLEQNAAEQESSPPAENSATPPLATS